MLCVCFNINKKLRFCSLKVIYIVLYMHYVYAAIHVKKQLLSRLNYVIAGGNIVIDVIDVILGSEVNLGLAEKMTFVARARSLSVSVRCIPA